MWLPTINFYEIIILYKCFLLMHNASLFIFLLNSNLRTWQGKVVLLILIYSKSKVCIGKATVNLQS
jgi:hypothetical protein